MPRRLNTGILFTVEQKAFALGAWMETESIAQAMSPVRTRVRVPASKGILGKLDCYVQGKALDKSTRGIAHRHRNEDSY